MKKSIILLTAITLLIVSCTCTVDECGKCFKTGSQKTECSTKSETPVIDAIMTRRSIRQYRDIPVEREKLQKIAECAINAPNAMNKQEWEVRIVDSKEYFDGVTSVMKKAMPGFVKDDDPKFRNCFRNASAIFAIACPDDESGMTLLNVGLMGENICLSALDLGLGTCCLGGPVMMLNTVPEAKPYLDRLGFSEGYKLKFIIAVGYPDESPEAKPRDAGKVKFIQ